MHPSVRTFGIRGDSIRWTRRKPRQTGASRLVSAIDCCATPAWCVAIPSRRGTIALRADACPRRPGRGRESAFPGWCYANHPDRARGLWLARRAQAARNRDARRRRRRSARAGARGVGERAGLAPGAGRAVLHSTPRGHRGAEVPRPRRRSRRPRVGGRKERHAVQAGGRGAGRGGRQLRRIRRDHREATGAEAAGHHLRAGGDAQRRRAHGAAWAAQPGAGSRRTARARQRCRRRRRNLCRADREMARRARDRRDPCRKRRPRPLHWLRPGYRSRRRRLHQPPRAGMSSSTSAETGRSAAAGASWNRTESSSPSAGRRDDG
jgi:hypothetical protein